MYIKVIVHAHKAYHILLSKRIKYQIFLHIADLRREIPESMPVQLAVLQKLVQMMEHLAA